MGFYKEDYYDECKGYCTYTLLLDVLDEIEDEQRYDDSLKDIQVDRIREYVKMRLGQMEQLRLGRILKE